MIVVDLIAEHISDQQINVQQVHCYSKIPLHVGVHKILRLSIVGLNLKYLKYVACAAL